MDAHISPACAESKRKIKPKTAAASTCPSVICKSRQAGHFMTRIQTTSRVEIIAMSGAVVAAGMRDVATCSFRAGFRQRELTVRLSMGATRTRLIRQLLTESLILAGLGGTLGILVAYSGQELLPAPIGSSGTFDVRALAVITASPPS